MTKLSRPKIKKDVKSLVERLKTEAASDGVHWLIYVAQQDKGMADILSRMAKSELENLKK